MKRIVGAGSSAASRVEPDDADGAMTGVCFCDFSEDGEIRAVTGRWPTPAELPASRAHLVGRYRATGRRPR